MNTKGEIIQMLINKPWIPKIDAINQVANRESPNVNITCLKGGNSKINKAINAGDVFQKHFC